jgi:hypothetical protein
MEPFAREVLEQAAGGGPLSLILDQSKMSERHQVLMLALRWGERALPLAWRVERTDGAIGFETQRALLEAVAPWLPKPATVRLLGDRFYGTADLIGWCQERGWDYRLRLKGNLVVVDGTGRTTTGRCAKDRVYYLEDVELTGRRARTHIGIIHDPGHAEPWIIAMSETPGYLRTLEYSARWGIEIVFTQMTKAPPLAIRTERDDIADFDLVVGNHHAIDQQFHKLTPLGEVSLGQSRLNPPAEIRGRGRPARELRLTIDLGFQLIHLGVQRLHFVFHRLAPTLVFRQRNNPELIGLGQTL